VDLKAIGCEGVDRINAALERDLRRHLVNTVMNYEVHKNGEFHDSLSDYYFLKKDFVSCS
jgi:hypothetical protein